MKLTRIRVEKYKNVDRDENRHTFLKLGFQLLYEYDSSLNGAKNPRLVLVAPGSNLNPFLAK